MAVSRSNFDPLIDVVEVLCYVWKVPEIQNLCQRLYTSLGDYLITSSSSCGSIETCHFSMLQFPQGETVGSGNRKAMKYVVRLLSLNFILQRCCHECNLMT